MSKWQIAGQYFEFIRKYKKWWVMPIVTLLLLFGILIIFGQSSVLGPFIYTLF